MNEFEEFRQLIAMFFAPSSSMEEWIQEVAQMYQPPDYMTYKLIDDIEHKILRLPDDRLKELWNSARPQIVLRDPAEIRLFILQILSALKRVASQSAN